MPKVMIELGANEEKDIDEIWQINKRRLRKEAMQRMGWNKVEDFLADVLMFGLDKAAENPVAFIKLVRDEKDPLFVKDRKKEPPKKVEETWGKAYA